MSIDYSKYEGHTKGPWGRDDDVNPEMITAGLDKKGAFIYVAIDADPNSGICDSRKEMHANHALVIDAPILLARCNELEVENAELRKRLECPNILFNKNATGSYNVVLGGICIGVASDDYAQINTGHVVLDAENLEDAKSKIIKFGQDVWNMIHGELK